ncbi:MAG: hypothetical protein CVU35_01505 [Betaproteobacteria bacterium HGW-Betaproteobacteria-8]|nr:MAG: hypothetical protein CVU35_01505 [Betaproteobacteria bacterium HGW-Betaproteobacteria-8]
MKALKKYGIWIALALTLSATLWVSMTEETSGADAGITAPTRAKKARMPALSIPKLASPTQSTELNMDKLQRAPLSETPGNLFNVEPADAEPAGTEAVAAVVEIPPLPFVYVGKLEDQGRYIVFLTSGNKNYSVVVGDVIDQWQVKSVRPPQMILSYLPLKSDVPLIIGEVN